MIDSKELMINNWVLLDGNYTQVQFIEPSEIDGEKRLEPIPITPQLLSKIEGFKPQKTSEWYIEYDNDNFIVIKSDMSVHLAYDVDVYIEIKYPHIKAIHQLQNTIFCLSGNELKVSLNQ